MTRVYLMADFGKGPEYVTARRRAPGGFLDVYASRRAGPNARAWWLVSAESADAARAIIAGPESCDRCDGSREEPGAPVEQDGALALCSSCSSGRILASGGAK